MHTDPNRSQPPPDAGKSAAEPAAGAAQDNHAGAAPSPPTSSSEGDSRHAQRTTSGTTVGIDVDKTAAMQSSGGRLTALGRFPIEERIAEGGMGVVYRAYDPDLHRVIAIKRVHPRFAHDREYTERFLAEARAIAAVTHPNIVQVFSIHAEQGESPAFFVMEYVDGPSVETFVRSEGPLAPARAAAIAIEIARGLREAQARGLLHQDVNPRNVLLTERGAVKLVDFGLARRLHDARPGVEGGPIVGSPHYLSPEHARNWAVAHRSDLYSLGCTLFFMLTGRPPYGGTSAAEVLAAHIGAPIPSVAEARPGVPARLDRLVQRLMAKRAEDRHRSYDELIEELEPFTDRGDLERQSRTPPWYAAKSVWALAAACVALAAFAGYVALATRAPPGISPHQYFGRHYIAADGAQSEGLRYDFTTECASALARVEIEEPVPTTAPSFTERRPARRADGGAVSWENFAGRLLFPAFEELEQFEIRGLRFRGRLDFEVRLGFDPDRPGDFLRVYFAVGSTNSSCVECKVGGESLDVIDREEAGGPIDFTIQQGAPHTLRVSRSPRTADEEWDSYRFSIEQELGDGKTQERCTVRLRVPRFAAPRGAAAVQADWAHDAWEVSLEHVLIRGTLRRPLDVGAGGRRRPIQP